MENYTACKKSDEDLYTLAWKTKNEEKPKRTLNLIKNTVKLSYVHYVTKIKTLRMMDVFQ